MAFKVTREQPVGGVLADRRLCLTADKSEVVEPDDPRAAFLFATEGVEISAGDVERLGLGVAGGRIVLAGAEPDLSGLPKDMPARDALIAAGLGSVEDVTAHPDLTEFDGIGKATAAKIVDYLAAEDEGDAGDA